MTLKVVLIYCITSPLIILLLFFYHMAMDMSLFFFLNLLLLLEHRQLRDLKIFDAGSTEHQEQEAPREECEW